MDAKAVVAVPDRCSGCKQCELICSFVYEKGYSPRLSRIKVVHFEDRGLSVPVTCAYCDRPVCEEVCPVGAMTHNPDTGAALVKEELCLGCKECVNACPLGAVEMHPGKRVALRCDLCGGDPACVRHCSYKALKFEPSHLGVKSKRRARVEAWNLE